MSPTADIAHLDRLLAGMPPVAALGLRVQSLDDAALKLAAPLALNVNDKGCAFGGSLASLLTLAAWGALETALRRAGIELCAQARCPEGRVVATLEGRYAAVLRR